MNNLNQTSFAFHTSNGAKIETPPATAADQLLALYSAFVDKTVKQYLDDYKAYSKGGGKESFFKQCWWLMMNETVDEADRLLQKYAQHNSGAEKLSRELQKIAEERLLHVTELALL
jgi:hypothetical protein